MSVPVDPRIAELRGRIDALDEQLIAVLAERVGVVREVARHKTDEAAVRAPDRVEQVVAKVRALAEAHGLPPELVEKVYRLLIAELTALELASVERRLADGAGAAG
ncbi:chorismate mutase [Kitasatospora sp. NPDC096147]|uniref:chorismate mutase n=1 Tax=Kitasatospora sp. NPDC096147 TaxID=3364093 RepID=UPI0037F7A144